MLIMRLSAQRKCRLHSATIGALSVCATAMLMVQPVLAQNVAGGMGVAPPPKVKPADRVRNSLARAGITICAPMIAQAAQFLFEDGEGNFTIQPLGRDVNRSPVVLTMESAHASMGRTRLTVVTIAPAGTCSGSYEQIITWSQTCDVLKKTVFAPFKDEKLLYQSVRQSELSAGVQLYLMPSGTGCVSIKKELIG